MEYQNEKRKFCPSCGASVVLTAERCPNCGQKFSDGFGQNTNHQPTEPVAPQYSGQSSYPHYPSAQPLNRNSQSGGTDNNEQQNNNGNDVYQQQNSSYGYNQQQNGGYGYNSYQNNTTVDPDEQLIRQLIGKKQEHYWPIFLGIKRYNASAGFNWCAFLFGPLWFLYRKMYAWGFGLIALNVCFSAVELVVDSKLLSIISFAVNVIEGIVGNKLYCQDINKRLIKYKANGENASYLYLQQLNGTSSGMVWLGILAAMVLSGIAVALFGDVTQYSNILF